MNVNTVGAYTSFCTAKPWRRWPRGAYNEHRITQARVLSSWWVDQTLNTSALMWNVAHGVKLFFRRVCRGPLLGECENSWTCIFHLIVRTGFWWVERQERMCQVPVHKQACTDALRTHLTVLFWGWAETVSSQSTRTSLRCKKKKKKEKTWDATAARPDSVGGNNP